MYTVCEHRLSHGACVSSRGCSRPCVLRSAGRWSEEFLHCFVIAEGRLGEPAARERVLLGIGYQTFDERSECLRLRLSRRDALLEDERARQGTHQRSALIAWSSEYSCFLVNAIQVLIIQLLSVSPKLASAPEISSIAFVADAVELLECACRLLARPAAL